ncbi:MAG TPA: hypothetical protein VNM67_08890 [Thermoanaerobaculia bacterium]|jgi:hypothetical protein|nr:hypothetical protein [Thermoanaerobaculia bacterium]
MRSLRLILLPALPALLLACSAAPSPASASPSQTRAETETQPAAAAVDIRGKITQFHRASYGEPPLATILVEGSLEEDTRYDLAQVRITRDTKVFQTRAGRRLPYSQLRVGDLVEVAFEGPVTESDPVQGVAAEIVRLASEPVQQ